MLYLNPPFHVIHGVTVFADHADPRQFYYLPAVPRLARNVDPQTGRSHPQLQLLLFRELGDDLDGGGFLSFTVSLGLDDEVLAEVREEVGRIFGVSGEPRLAPVVLEDGAVRLMILGKETPTDPEAPEPPASAVGDASRLPPFVVSIVHPTKPTLYGDNQAIFSVQLDKAGATAVLRSFEGHMMPIGIIYELEFLALRPAFNVHIHADWERVQTHLREQTSERVLFFSSEIDDIVDELIESQVIVIEVDNFVPEGEDAANVVTNPTAIIDHIKETVLDTFFEPSIHPVSTAASDWDEFTDTATRLSTMAVTGGWAGIATYSRVEVDLTRIDRKRFDFNLRERATVRRRIYPQAHLEGLARSLREEGTDLGDFVIEIDGLDPFFRTRAVKVVNGADFAGDRIGTIGVRLRYGDRTREVTLRSGTTEEDVAWPALVEAGETRQDVEASYTVRFTGVSSVERPVELRSGVTTVTDNSFPVAPAGELYHLVNVPVTALDFPWEAYPNVQVDLRYEDPDHGIEQRDRVMLDADRPTDTWQWFLLDRDKDRFDYRVVYHAVDHRDVSSDWITTDTADVLLRDPRPNRRAVSVVPAVSWDVVARIFVDVSYHDARHGVRAEQSLQFSSGDAEPKGFTVALEDPANRAVRYVITLLFTDNSLVELPASSTIQNQIIVRADMRGHRVVTVRPDDVDFGGAGVREVRAVLRYDDADNGLVFHSELVFTGSADVGYFEFDYVDVARQSFTAAARTIFANGFVATWPTLTTDQDEVVVRVT